MDYGSDEKKGGDKLAILIAMKAKKKMMDKDEGGDDKFSDIAGDVLEAIKSEDAEGLAEALKTFVKACEGGGPLSDKDDKEY